MALLKVGKYRKIDHLIQPLNYHLALSSIVNGFTPGAIYVDDAEKNEAAFIFYRGKAWLLGESENKEYNITLTDEILPSYFNRLRKQGINAFRLHYSQSWKENIERIFKKE